MVCQTIACSKICASSHDLFFFFDQVLEGSVSSNQKCLALSKADLPSSEHHGKMVCLCMCIEYLPLKIDLNLIP